MEAKVPFSYGSKLCNNEKPADITMRGTEGVSCLGQLLSADTISPLLGGKLLCQNLLPLMWKIASVPMALQCSYVVTNSS